LDSSIHFVPRENGIRAKWPRRKWSNFLTHLARDENVAASTQNQALSALLFLYKEVLKRTSGD